MVQKYTYNGLTWIDVESPIQSEIATLVKEYKLHPSVGEELLSTRSEPRVELHKDYVFLTLDFPGHSQHGKVVTKEIDFVIGDTFIITTKYDTIEPLHNFSRVFETNSVIDKTGIGEHAGFIFYYMMKKLYRHIGRDLMNIRDALRAAEEQVFEGDERKMVAELSVIGREIIDMKQVLRTHRDTLELAADALEEMFSAKFRTSTTDLISEYESVSESADNLHELLIELRETNDSLLTAKQNEVMKNLTLMAFITFPLSLFVGLFSMGARHTPIIGGTYDFQIILTIIVLAVIGMLWMFKKKKWL